MDGVATVSDFRILATNGILVIGKINNIRYQMRVMTVGNDFLITISLYFLRRRRFGLRIDNKTSISIQPMIAPARTNVFLAKTTGLVGGALL